MSGELTYHKDLQIITVWISEFENRGSIWVKLKFGTS